jgi:hypothetical protein
MLQLKIVVRCVTSDDSEFCHFSLSSLFAPGDSPTGRPTRKSSKAVRALLDRIRQTETGDQSTDDPANFVESELESDSNVQASSDDSEEEPVVPVQVQRVRQPAAKKKVKPKAVVDTGDVSDDDDGMYLLLRHLLVAIAYNFICTVPFRIMLEIANQRKGSRSIQEIQSTITWTTLQEDLARLLDVYPSSLQAQYRLSTQPKALPLDLQTENDLNMMVTMLRPLIIPPLLQSGRRSTRQMKPVTVHIFNRDDVMAISDKVCYRHIFFRALCSPVFLIKQNRSPRVKRTLARPALRRKRADTTRMHSMRCALRFVLTLPRISSVQSIANLTRCSCAGKTLPIRCATR